MEDQTKKIGLLLISLGFFHYCAFAQDLPNRPIRIVVPFAAGGTNDVLARLVGRHLQVRTGHPVIIDNRPGASGIIAAEYFAKSVPDGTTLLMASSTTHGANPILFKQLSYDAERDFTAVCSVAQLALALVVSQANAARDLKEFVANARESSEPINIGFAGVGSASHLVSELFKQLTGVKAENIIYKGDAPVLNDLIAGHITAGFPVVAGITSFVGSDTIRILGVSSPARTTVLPDVPTFAEAGYPGVKFIAWMGIMGPANIPANIASALANAIPEIINLPEVAAMMRVQGVDPLAVKLTEFSSFILEQRKEYEAIITSAKIKVD